MTERVPSPGVWLGALGLIPFVALALASALLDGEPRSKAMVALGAYGAVILSFLGGIHWGLAIAETNERAANWRRLTVGVVPSLVAWSALLVEGPAGLTILAASFALLLLVDWQAARRAEAPTWYPRLRAPLTLCVVVALSAGALQTGS